MEKILYQEFGPDNCLKSIVKRFWQLTNSTPDPKQYTILPDGYFDLVIKISQGKLKDIFLTGIYTEEFLVTYTPGTSFLGISFLPIAAEQIFQQSISSLINRHEAMPPAFWNLKTMDILNFDCWVKQVSRHLLSIRMEKKDADKKQDLFNLLFLSNGSLKVEELSNKVFWSSRQISRYFKNTFGLSLKTYSNILRCKASYRGLKEGDRYPDGNFSDQAHYIKQIKRFTGTTPKILARNENDRFIQFLTVGSG